MNNPWFRFYAEFATDPKVQFMSEALQRRYVFALCVTCNGEIEKVTDEELAFAMRITPEDWAETKKTFIERGLFTPEGRVKNWDKRQYKSDVIDPTNAERQKRYRDRMRNGGRNGDVTEEKRPDTDTDTDDDTAEVPYHDVVMAYNKFCKSAQKSNLDVSEPRQQLIRAFWHKYSKHDGGPWRVLDTVFRKVECSPFLSGKIKGSDGRFFKVRFDWLFKLDVMSKVLEGFYDETPAPKERERGLVL